MILFIGIYIPDSSIIPSLSASMRTSKKSCLLVFILMFLFKYLFNSMYSSLLVYFATRSRVSPTDTVDLIGCGHVATGLLLVWKFPAPGP